MTTSTQLDDLDDLGIDRADPVDPVEPSGDSPARLVEAERLPAAVEALLVVTDVPLPAAVLAEVLEVPTADVDVALAQLRQSYDDHDHGFGLVAVAGGWRLATRPEFAAVVERHLRSRQRVRLTQAALEALAVVAYQQPVTRALVSSVRGVASDGVLRTLVGRGLVEECGSDDSGALRYRTTPAFLEKLGLNELAELPPLAPHLPDLAELAEPPSESFGSPVTTAPPVETA